MDAPPEPPVLGAVASPDTFGTDVAEDVLRRGGNAVDAAVAVAFSLAVTYPEAGNIGGGGFMLIRFEGKDYFLDYRETAPAAATRDMFLDSDGNVMAGLSLIGHRAAGVPGTVAGLWAAHQRFGALPWAELVGPSIALASGGFLAPEQLAERAAGMVRDMEGLTNFADYFGAVEPGKRFSQPELSRTLTRIAVDGPDGFYAGDVAELIAGSMRRFGGLITTDDLARYQPVWREPLRAIWRDYTVLSAPPPSSGGFAVLQLLGMKDALADDFEGLAHNSPGYIHLVAEMEKRVFADRAQYFGDPDFVDVPINALLAPEYIRRRAGEVNKTAISSLDAARPGLQESRSTTHYSVVDAAGNAVSNTYTINGWFGSGAVVEGAGFLLNNEMDDFSAKPGAPNLYGVVGGDANAIEPGKRMLSSMSPTLILNGDDVEMVVGSPGGSTIFTSVFQAIVNIEDFGMTPDEAAAATRFHHQLLDPTLVTFSPTAPLPDAAVEALETLGYRAEPHPWIFGDLQILHRDSGGWRGGSDPRGRGNWRVIRAPLDP
ncbi:MAG: gamma-glutamyltransferase [Pseudomonadota bacterium]